MKGYSDHDDARALTRIDRDMAPGLRIDDQAARDAHLNAIETEIRAEDAAGNAPRFWVHREDDVEFDDDGQRVQGYTVRGRAGYVSGRFYHPALAQALCDELNLADSGFPKSMGVIEAEQRERFYVERVGATGMWAVVDRTERFKPMFLCERGLADAVARECNIDPTLRDPNRIASRPHDDTSRREERERWNHVMEPERFDEMTGPMESEDCRGS